ncbi:MAG TPA: type II toxin-antitoxin system RelE/ParE family toxin [Methanoregulaceae archaeon]|nr:type II toxin-antitoxin system RelE/ParE family toxin [Methanoregulaceae archaeon]
MTYEVVFTKEAERASARLDRQVANRIEAELDSLAGETVPDRYVKQLKGNDDPPFYSLRVGDYRVVLQIHDNRLVILVIEIGPRDSIYRKF